MKILGVIIAVVLLSINTIAQRVQKSPKSVLTQVVGTTEVKISYHRPGLKGRALNTIIHDGKVWRTGANEATEITFSKPVKIGGKSIKSGTYSLYTIPGKNEWTIIMNSKLSWGTKYSKENDVLRFTSKVMKTSTPTETFTINVSDISADGKKANIELEWGNIAIKAPLEVRL